MVLIPAFQLHLRHPILQGLATVGKCARPSPPTLPPLPSPSHLVMHVCEGGRGLHWRACVIAALTPLIARCLFEILPPRCPCLPLLSGRCAAGF